VAAAEPTADPKLEVMLGTVEVAAGAEVTALLAPVDGVDTAVDGKLTGTV
jgi:hypothetical protein